MAADSGGANTTRRRWPRRALVAGALAAVAFNLAFFNFLYRGNFAVVVEGQLYRSAQPRGGLDGWIGTHRIASILNLRGVSKDYPAEIETAQKRGVDVYDLPMRATQRPTRNDLLTILDFFEACRYPLLIHCKSGSDRTGMAVGLYLLMKGGKSPEAAEEAFTAYHGHVALGGTEHLHAPFREYAAWLRSQHLTHDPERFRSWVATQYDAEDLADATPKPLRPVHRGEAPAPAVANGASEPAGKK